MTDAESSRKDGQMTEQQKAVGAGFGTAVGMISFVVIGLAIGLPDMAVFWSLCATAVVIGVYLGGGYYE